MKNTISEDASGIRKDAGGSADSTAAGISREAEKEIPAGSGIGEGAGGSPFRLLSRVIFGSWSGIDAGSAGLPLRELVCREAAADGEMELLARALDELPEPGKMGDWDRLAFEYRRYFTSVMLNVYGSLRCLTSEQLNSLVSHWAFQEFVQDWTAFGLESGMLQSGRDSLDRMYFTLTESGVQCQRELADGYGMQRCTLKAPVTDPAAAAHQIAVSSFLLRLTDSRLRHTFRFFGTDKFLGCGPDAVLELEDLDLRLTVVVRDGSETAGDFRRRLKMLGRFSTLPFLKPLDRQAVFLVLDGGDQEENTALVDEIAMSSWQESISRSAPLICAGSPEEMDMAARTVIALADRCRWGRSFSSSTGADCDGLTWEEERWGLTPDRGAENVLFSCQERIVPAMAVPETDPAGNPVLWYVLDSRLAGVWTVHAAAVIGRAMSLVRLSGKHGISSALAVPLPEGRDCSLELLRTSGCLTIPDLWFCPENWAEYGSITDVLFRYDGEGRRIPWTGDSTGSSS